MKKLFTLSLLLCTVFAGCDILNSEDTSYDVGDLFNSQEDRDNDEQIMKDVVLLQASLNVYYTQHNAYPESIEEIVGLAGLNDVPVHPVTHKPYTVKYTEGGTKFCVYAVLESGTNMKNDAGTDMDRYEVGDGCKEL